MSSQLRSENLEFHPFVHDRLGCCQVSGWSQAAGYAEIAIPRMMTMQWRENKSFLLSFCSDTPLKSVANLSEVGLAFGHIQVVSRGDRLTPSFSMQNMVRHSPTPHGNFQM